MVKLRFLEKRKDGALLHRERFPDLELYKHFRVLKVLGSGSFATVYQVQRKSDGCFYALKHIDIRAIDPSERTDLVNEIRLLASLDHPNLMKYYEAFIDHAQLMIVTELVANGDLGTLLEKRAEYEDWLPERQIWAYFLQLAVGLQYLHHNHVLHRDLKPQNVLMAEGGLLKIADLGISQMLDHVFTRVLMGTPHYISPEMWRRQPYSYSADVWALGCILHEMASLKPLFLAPTDREVRAKVLSGLLDPIPRRYSLDLWDAIRVMLNPDPAERPTIDEVLAMPAVQARVSLLPREDLPYLDPSHDDHASIMKMVRISTRFDNWDTLNDLLPPSKYKEGPGVVETLRMRRPNSCPDLTRLSTQPGRRGSPAGTAASAAAAAGGGARRPPGGSLDLPLPPPLPPSPGAPGGRRRSLEQRPAAAGGVHHSSSCPRLDGWEQDEAFRRRSIAVGQLLYHRQKEAEEASGGQLGGGSGGGGSCFGAGPPCGGGTAADALRGPQPGSPRSPRWVDGIPGSAGALSMKRTKSSGALLRPERRGGGERLPWAGLEGLAFDASPLEFGGGGGGGSAAAQLCAGGGGGMHQPLYIPSGSGYCGDTMAAAAADLPFHAATMVAGHMGEHRQPGSPAALAPAPFRDSADSADSGGGGRGRGSGGSPKAVLAPAGGSALGGGGSGGARGPSSGGATAAAGAAAHGLGQRPAPKTAPAGKLDSASSGKEGKKKVKFKSRLRRMFFGDEVDDGMHQPVW